MPSEVRCPEGRAMFLDEAHMCPQVLKTSHP